MKKKKINIYHLFAAFIDWGKTNNWIHEEDEDLFLTIEGEDEMEALGLNIQDIIIIV